VVLAEKQHFAILGFPLEHSQSPRIHQLAFKTFGMNAVYLKREIPPENFDREILQLKEENWRGFNVTIPFKEKILPYLDEVHPVAREIGAVNTILVQGKRWIGFNTDWLGFLRPIESALPRFERCLILGAGGAARAVGFALLQKAPALQELTVANRTLSRAKALVEALQKSKKLHYRARDLGTVHQERQTYDLIVNTTALGMGAMKTMSPLDLSGKCHDRTVVYDLIYNPAETAFLRQARMLGINAVNGLPMLIFQAEEAFKIWTGRSFGEALLRELMETLGN
jgi:shikimate dehydrogenase